MDEFGEVAVREVHIPGTQRPLVTERVKELSESIKRLGLSHPIGVGHDRTLVYGGHRLAAFALLGRVSIPCRWVDGDGDVKLLTMLDENLVREELTVVQRSEWLSEKEAVLRRIGERSKRGGTGANQYQEQTAHVERSAPGSVKPKTTAELAAEANLSVAQYKRHLQVVKTVDGGVLKLLQGTKLADTLTTLLALGKLPVADQLWYAEAYKAKDTVTMETLLPKAPRRSRAEAVAENKAIKDSIASADNQTREALALVNAPAEVREAFDAAKAVNDETAAMEILADHGAGLILNVERNGPSYTIVRVYEGQLVVDLKPGVLAGQLREALSQEALQEVVSHLTGEVASPRGKRGVGSMEKRQRGEGAVQLRILSALREAGQPLTKEALALVVGVKVDSLSSELTWLRRAGKVTNAGTEGRAALYAVA